MIPRVLGPLLALLLGASAFAGDDVHVLPAKLVELVEQAGAGDQAHVREVADRLLHETGGDPTELLHLLTAVRGGAESLYDRDVVPGATGEAALWQALRGLRAADRREASVAFAAGGAERARTALAALVDLDGPTTLRAVLELAREADLDVASRLAAEVADDLTRRVRADRGLLSTLGEALRRDGGMLGSVEVRVIVACGDDERTGREAFEELGRALGWTESLRRDVLLGLGALAPLATVEARARACEVVRPFLASDDALTLQAALDTFGALGAVEHIDLVLAALDHEHAGVRTVAQRVLSELTGQRFPAQAKPWRLWLAREQDWRDRRSEAVLSDLDHCDPQVVLAALQELSRHPLYRARSGPAVADLAASRDERIALAACRALGRLRAEDQVTVLLPRLDDDSERVREAAHVALQRITELSLPLDRDAWSAVVEPAARPR